MRTWVPVLGLSILISAPALLSGQDRDVRGQRLVLDDNGGGGTTNTMTIMTDPGLSSNIMLTIPDPGGPAQFLLAPPGSNGAWLLGGNAGTVFGTDVLGTSDATRLQIGVNGGGSNSLILNTNYSVQRDVGGNARGFWALDLQVRRTAPTQVAAADGSVIINGERNTITPTGGISAIVAGLDHTISAVYGFIGGGTEHDISGLDAGIIAGQDNSISGARSFIGGGLRNNVSGDLSAIIGGHDLTLSGNNSVGFSSGGAMTVSTGNTAVFGNTNLWLANTSNTAGQLRFYEAQATTGAFPGAGTNYTAFVAGPQTGDITYTLPTTAPTAGQVLHSDASGNLNWAAAGTSGVVFNRVTTAGPTYNANSTDGIIGVDVSGGAVTVNLPAANTLASGCVMIVNVEQGNASTNNVTINAAAGDTFDGTATTSLTITFGQGQFKFYSDGANGWYTY